MGPIALFVYLLPLLIELLALYLLSRTLGKLVASIGSRGLYYFLVLPGTIAHELSHAAAAVLCRERIRRMSLFEYSADSMQLGSVEHTVKKDSWRYLKLPLISLAPLVGCSAVLFWITRLFFAGVVPIEVTGIEPDLQVVFSSVSAMLWEMDYTLPETWLFLYLALSLSLGAAPSRADIKNCFTSLLVLGAVLALFGYAGQRSALFGSALAEGMRMGTGVLLALEMLFSFGIAFALLGALLVLPFASLARFRRRSRWR